MRLYVVLLVTLLALAGCETAASDSAVRSEAPSANATADDVGGERPALEVGRFETVEGTRLLTASVQYENAPSRSSYSDRGWYGAMVNQMFYHLDTRTHRRLFAGDEQRLLEMRPIVTALDTLVNLGPGPASVPPIRPVRAFLYRVVTADTNGDERLDADDLVTLSASAPDGTSYTVLAEAVDRVRQVRRIDDTRVLVVYAYDDEVHGLELDVDKLDVLHRVDFSTPPQPSL